MEMRILCYFLAVAKEEKMTKNCPKCLGENVDYLNIVVTFDLSYNVSIMVKEGFNDASIFNKLVDISERSELCF